MSTSSSATSYSRQLHNHINSKRGIYTMSWEERVTGEHHNVLWTVTCKINGEVRGTGSGPRKSVAKEEAARITLLALGVELRSDLS